MNTKVTFILTIIVVIICMFLTNFQLEKCWDEYMWFSVITFFVIGTIINIIVPETDNTQTQISSSYNNKEKTLDEIIKNSNTLHVSNYGFGNKIRISGNGEKIISNSGCYKNSLQLVNYIVKKYNYKVVSGSEGDYSYVLTKN